MRFTIHSTLTLAVFLCTQPVLIQSLSEEAKTLGTMVVGLYNLYYVKGPQPLQMSMQVNAMDFDKTRDMFFFNIEFFTNFKPYSSYMLALHDMNNTVTLSQISTVDIKGVIKVIMHESAVPCSEVTMDAETKRYVFSSGSCEFTTLTQGSIECGFINLVILEKPYKFKKIKSYDYTIPKRWLPAKLPC